MANPQQGTNNQAAPQAIRESVPHILERLGIAVTELVSDSRRAMPGTVFAAYPGETRDGRDFIAQAVAQRVDGVLWEADHYQWDPALAIPNAGVAGPKKGPDDCCLGRRKWSGPGAAKEVIWRRRRAV